MNYLILDPSQKIHSGEFKISNQGRINHILKVLQKREGDRIKAGLLDTSLGIFKIRKLSPDGILGSYTEILKPKRRSPSIHLILSVQRPPTVEKILELAGVWGVQSLEFRLASLSRTEYLTSPIWKEENIREKLILGMEQGGNVFFPKWELGFVPPGKKSSFQKKGSISEIINSSRKFFYLDKKGRSIQEFLPLDEKEYCILVGPEPGWTKAELEIFRKSNIPGVRLSSSVLRSEQAVSFFLSQWENSLPR
ncbi:RsmE family RNA methyltransferase [Leptospira licerasiae]|uniref:Ribosomal RNA small subunit methyltransferase E n=1 Tax=Leptospira licerasiae str. MMD4847 TaxID=1049971 RepID=A0ABN0H9S7_9LEPT|nr:RsmE family RNA methyltransferase [Leptospira licerasiae]EIE01531.1 RNA methyltransferase, RsmE family [Leptospira licerasiae serovar Varillal str. VAR 010]EJZ42464.1 RNA methyltransferase, RsmE family [Leptospira licerasiae str. MMD4847]